MSIYVRLRQLIQPYYRPKPKVAKAARDRAKARPAKAKAGGAPAPAKTTARGVRVLNYEGELTNAARFKKRPSPNTIYCYSDDKVIQVFACFPNGDAGRRYPARNDHERKKLKPLIYPDQGVPFHRTHLIPIGFHGSENDPRLLVGWDGTQNCGPLKQFERKVIDEVDHPFYWLTSINRAGNGAQWHYRIFDARNADAGEPAPLLRGYSLDLELKCPFVWRTKAKSG